MECNSGYAGEMAKDIARQLRSLIHRSGKSVSELSRLSGITQSTLSRFVNGNDMSVHRAAMLAKVLGVELKRIKKPR